MEHHSSERRPSSEGRCHRHIVVLLNASRLVEVFAVSSALVFAALPSQAKVLESFVYSLIVLASCLCGFGGWRHLRRQCPRYQLRKHRLLLFLWANEVSLAVLVSIEDILPLLLVLVRPAQHWL